MNPPSSAGSSVNTSFPSLTVYFRATLTPLKAPATPSARILSDHVAIVSASLSIALPLTVNRAGCRTIRAAIAIHRLHRVHDIRHRPIWGDPTVVDIREIRPAVGALLPS